MYPSKPLLYAGQNPKDDAFREGVVFAISALRNLQPQDLKEWSHSRNIVFAPVELSDYILLKYKSEYNGTT